ncbi:MAG: hypothetical protein ACE5LS_06275, partial [Thermoplasmata archaeon]
MNFSDKGALSLVGRRFVLLLLTIFAALVWGLLITNLFAPVRPLDSFNLAYIAPISLIVALTFGGLYAAAGVLRRPDLPGLNRKKDMVFLPMRFYMVFAAGFIFTVVEGVLVSPYVSRVVPILYAWIAWGLLAALVSWKRVDVQ